MTPTEAAPSPLPTDHETRLHPFSWLFVLIEQIRQFIVPLLVLVVFGRGDRSEWWPLLGAAVLVGIAVWQYATFRYRVTADSVVIRSGLFDRSLREIPFSRIQNVSLRQNPLHRLFGVAEVWLESAASSTPEAKMRVLRLRDALALDGVIRHAAHPASECGAPAAAAADVLLALDTGEVVRVGVVSNRGMVVVGAAMAAALQLSDGALTGLFEAWGRRLLGYASRQHLDALGTVVAGLAVVVAALLVLRLLSVLLAVLKYHGFRLTQSGRRLSAEQGLLSRMRSSLPRRRIQAWTLKETWLHRRLRRRAVSIDAPGGMDLERGAAPALRELAPIATPAVCDALINHLLPASAVWPPPAWDPVHPSARWRLPLAATGFAAFVLLVAVPLLWWRIGPWALLALAWLPWRWWLGWQDARHRGHAWAGGLVALREGWWSRTWRFAEVGKLQALQLVRSPLDRRCGTATLLLDTMGTSGRTQPLRLAFLPHAQAQAWLQALAGQVAATPPPH